METNNDMIPNFIDTLHYFDEYMEEDNKKSLLLNEKENVNNMHNMNTTLCNHIYSDEIMGNLYCSDCGLRLEKSVFQGKEWRIFSDDKSLHKPQNRVQIRRNEDKSIYGDIEQMTFPEKVKAEANKLYMEITENDVFRGSTRRAIICACIFHAHKKLGLIQTQDSLMKIFGLSRKSNLKGMKFVSQHAPRNSYVHCTRITPVDLIRDILNKFNASEEQMEEVVNIYNIVKNKSLKLNGSRPQSIGSGIVYYWIQKKGLNISIKEYSIKVGLSELTIMKISKEIDSILTKHGNILTPSNSPL
jgi:transcription initiation factor TFIIIB Brf1 subunit/transcription initiation factor TFIIB